ncbi:hypothetical protein D3C86_2227160 [compost metagenome]
MFINTAIKLLELRSIYSKDLNIISEMSAGLVMPNMPEKTWNVSLVLKKEKYSVKRNWRRN